MPRQFPGAEVPGLQFRRRRARHLQGPRHPGLQPAHRHRGHGHRRLRDGHQGRLQLHPRRDLRDLRPLRGGARRGARRRLPRRQASSAATSSFQLHAFHGFGAYICGEETALLESLEGKKGQPRFKPPFPASFGLYGKPTTINNTETFAAVPWIINHGGQCPTSRSASPTTAARRSSRSSATSSGPATTRCRSARRSPSCSNSPAACRGGRTLKAVIPGGSSAPVLPAAIDDGHARWTTTPSPRPARCSARAR